MISLLALPALACIVLVGIHVYFGSFVLKRGIVFIDIALAQWAAMGYIVGHCMGLHSALGLFCCSVLFTALAALILTYLRPLYSQVKAQEAVIGVLYIGASVMALTLISATGMEGYHITEMLAGHLLFIELSEGVYALLLYTGVALLLWRYHSYFLSNKTKKAEFLFYLLFGLVVTSSVKMAGILLVFSFLVIPILSIMAHQKTLKKQVIWGWIMGFLASLMGLGVSLFLDVPPSYCIIFMLILGWIGSIIVSIRDQRKIRFNDNAL